jgi:sulfoxide reductase catalytic subunit YedY
MKIVVAVESVERVSSPMSEFPLWLRLTHFFNFLLITLLIRSGIEILGGHPKLYWNDDSFPGSEWFRLGDKRTPEDDDRVTVAERERTPSDDRALSDGAGTVFEQPDSATEADEHDGSAWTAEDEAVPLSSWLALPGKDNLGLGRHWHFWAATGWAVTGLLYVVLLFASDQWQRIVPTSWSIVPQAWDALVAYLHLRIPHASGYNALQQLAYFAVIFILSPVMISTGLAMSPALAARFPRLSRATGGRQMARSIHFLGMIAFVVFIVIHVGLVVAHGFAEGMAKIVLGGADQPKTLATALGLVGIGAVIMFHIVATRYSLRYPMKAKKLLEVGIDPLQKRLFHHWKPRQEYDYVSDYARANGKPPRNDTYQRLLANNFEEYELTVDGLVENPLTLSLDELRDLPRQSQTTRHDCIQGWGYYAQWAGVPVSELIDRCEPKPEARYAVFWTLDEKWEYSEDGPEENVDNGYYYEVIDMEKAMESQTILADEMNHKPLPIAHGAPLRLRLESQLGYKMAKWVCRVEFVEDYDDIGQGQGGWRDDVLNYFPSDAGI